MHMPSQIYLIINLIWFYVIHSTNFHFVFCLPEELGPEPPVLQESCFCTWGIDERFFMWLTHISLDSRRCNSGGRVRLWLWCWLLSGTLLFQLSQDFCTSTSVNVELILTWMMTSSGIKNDSCFSVFNHRPVWDYSLFFIQFVCKYFQHSGNVQIITSYFPSFPLAIRLSHKISIILSSSVSNKVQAHKRLFLIKHCYIHS